MKLESAVIGFIFIFMPFVANVNAQDSDIDYSKRGNLLIGWSAGIGYPADMPTGETRAGRFFAVDMIYLFKDKAVDDDGMECSKSGSGGWGLKYINCKAENIGYASTVSYIGAELMIRGATTESEKNYLSLELGMGILNISKTATYEYERVSNSYLGFQGRLSFDTRIHDNLFISPGLDILLYYFNDSDKKNYDEGDIYLGLFGISLGLKYIF
ncbi:MAG: hypothetical protein FWF54_05765 [Candidatus Azobacteroides sp.]|nr:hypothetical protein [Candidatus Azobacteroides sp.]